MTFLPLFPIDCCESCLSAFASTKMVIYKSNIKEIILPAILSNTGRWAVVNDNWVLHISAVPKLFYFARKSSNREMNR